MSAGRQVLLLFGLRWRMLRSTRPRLVVTAAAGTTVGLLVGVGLVATSISREYEQTAQSLLPILLLAFVVISVLGGLAAGGGTEIVPSSQLVAFPVSPRAVYIGSVALAPLNFAWTVQMVVLVGLVVYVGDTWSTRTVASGLMLVFAAAATTGGLALSWWLAGLRQSRAWRIATNTIGIALIAGAIAAALAGQGLTLLRLPALNGLARQMFAPQPAAVVAWLIALALLTSAFVALGSRATAWSLTRRDEPSTQREARTYPRRTPHRSTWAATLATDRASVWRSRPIRRGLVLMGVAPGVAAAVSASEWGDLVVLPPLVAAGAALLFSINVFSLDGTGALWLESTPRRPRTAFLAKGWASAEVIVAAVMMTIGVVVVRLGLPQTSRLLLTLVLSVVVGVTWATALALRRSIRSPHKADLRSARDTPAPPAAMLGHALRLTSFATLIGAGFTLFVALGPLWLTLAFAALMLAWAGVHLRRTARTWQSSTNRSIVVSRVALG